MFFQTKKGKKPVDNIMKLHLFLRFKAFEVFPDFYCFVQGARSEPIFVFSLFSFETFLKIFVKFIKFFFFFLPHKSLFLYVHQDYIVSSSRWCSKCQCNYFLPNIIFFLKIFIIFIPVVAANKDPELLKFIIKRHPSSGTAQFSLKEPVFQLSFKLFIM